MNRVKRMEFRLALALLFFAAVSSASAEDRTRANAVRSPGQPVADDKLGPPVEQKLVSLPADRTFLHSKASEAGNAVAFWVRRPNAIQLFVTGREPMEFKGHMGFQKGMAFHAIQPSGELDIMSAGGTAEKDTWLVWGPATGIAGEPLDNYFIFDKTGDHIIYALYDKGRWSWMLDDEPLDDYHNLTEPKLSDDAKTIAWIAGSQGSRHVVVNGTPERPYEKIHDKSLSVSPDGRHFFYVASRSDKLLAVQDGEEHAEYANMGYPVFSPNGDHVAYSASNDGQHDFMVVDGKPGAEYDTVAAATFSADGQRFAHRADKDGKAFFVVDGEPQDIEFDDLANVFLFSPDGKRFAYAGVRGEIWYVVVDGKEGDGASGLFGMIFSSDGLHFAKGEIDSDGQMNIFVDGEKRWTHSGDPAMRPVFSPDGSHLLYAIRREPRMILVVDGVEGLDFAAVGNAAFSQDGEHLAFLARTDDGKQALYLDGQVQAEFDSVLCRLTFTPGDQLVFCATRDGKSHVVIDGVLSKPYDRLYLPASTVLSQRPDGSLAYIARDGNEVVQVLHRPVGR